MRNFHDKGRSPAFAGTAMAATSSPPATLAALDVLRAGGNAVDAAVTASAVLCVCEPHMTAIGGDCFALIGNAAGDIVGINGSGRAGHRADAAWLAASGLREIAADSVHAVTVPGAVDAWARLLERFGTFTLGQALEPAIELAERGVPIGQRTAHDWAGLIDKVNADAGARKHLTIAGRAPHPGEVMRFPALARTLRIIARDGRDGFYAGEVAADIVATLAERGGLLDMSDFATTEATWVDPISCQFAGHEICEIPPNGQGLTALIALNILTRFDLARLPAESVERRHLEIEAVRLAWVLRNRHICDPDAVAVDIDWLLSDELADELAGRISLERAIPEPENAVPGRGSDTVYLTVVDKDRLAVSFINSIFHGFGSGIVTEKTGVILQNRGAGFVTDPAHANCIGPRKRPLHTIIPAMVRRKGRIEMPFGVMGGAYQPMGHVAVALNRYVYGMDPQEAIDFPRAFHDDGVVGLEQRIPDAVAAGLADLGHRVVRPAEPWGGGQAIVIDPVCGLLTGGSDPRKDGLALGYD